MKKLIAIIIIASFIGGCNSGSSDTKTTKDSSMNMTSTDTMSTSMSPMAEGTVGMRVGKMMVMRSGEWKIMSQPVTCSDGCKVMPNGEVIMKNGDKMMLKESETVDKDGHMMDASGKMMMDEKMDMNDSMK
ncbi:MAG: DUF6799 domain-containing protein [Ginsengibacter sp.]